MKKIIVSLSVLVLITGSVSFNATASLPPPVAENKTTGPGPAKVKAAVEEFNNLSRKEKKAKIKEVKKQIRLFKKEKKNGRETDDRTILLVILAILLPPLAVYLYEEEINNRFWISLLLTILFWLPGVVYALVLILGGY
jgi:uncharacterized membrane protein YqaE (UPF0057 family)